MFQTEVLDPQKGSWTIAGAQASFVIQAQREQNSCLGGQTLKTRPGH